MEILIKTVENGFLLEVRVKGMKGWLDKDCKTYVAENERSLLDTISKLWREYKNDNPVRT